MQRLLDAMEQEGSGVLIHPMLGSMKVTPKESTKVTYSTKDCGYSFATLTFVESGDYVYPTSGVDTAAKVASAASGLNAAALQAFIKQFDLTGAQDFVISTISGRLSEYFQIDVYTTISSLFDASDEMATMASKAISYVNRTPRSFGQAVLNAFGFSRATYSVNNWRRVTRLLSRLVESDGMNNSYAVARKTAESSRATAASLQVQALARSAVLAEAISASANVGGSEDAAEGGISY